MACNLTLTGIDRKNVCDNVLGSLKAVYLRKLSSLDKTDKTTYKEFILNTDKGSALEEINGDRNSGVFIAQTIEFNILESKDAGERTLDIVEFGTMMHIPYLDAIVQFQDGTLQAFGLSNGMTVTGGSRTTGMTRAEGRTNVITLTGEEREFSKIVTWDI